MAPKKAETAAVVETTEAETEVEDSLHDDLVAALRGGGGAEEEVAAEAAAGEEAEAAPAEDTAEEPAEDAGVEPEAPAADDSESGAIEAPVHWSEPDKLFFQSLPDDDARKQVLDWRTQIEKGAQSKFDAAAEARKLHEEVVQLSSPYAEQMKQHGMTPADAVRRLFAAEKLLREDPAKGFLSLAEDYGRSIAGSEQARQFVQQMASAFGVEIGAPAPNTNGTGQAEPGDPALAKITTLEGRIAAFERQQDDAKRTQQQEALRRAETKLKDFTEAKTEDGTTILHPHFERVRATMALMVQASAQAGESLTLEDAYDRAVYADPELRKEMTRAEQERAARQAAEARRAHAARAERGRTPNMASVSSDAPKDQPLRDDLRDALREASARVRT